MCTATFSNSCRCSHACIRYNLKMQVTNDSGHLSFTFRCAVHYLNALLGDGMRDEAVSFVQTADAALKVRF